VPKTCGRVDHGDFSSPSLDFPIWGEESSVGGRWKGLLRAPKVFLVAKRGEDAGGGGGVAARIGKEARIKRVLSRRKDA